MGAESASPEWAETHNVGNFVVILIFSYLCLLSIHHNHKPNVVAHACNTNYLGDKDWKYLNPRPILDKTA
jgi:hypothetical protein